MKKLNELKEIIKAISTKGCLDLLLQLEKKSLNTQNLKTRLTSMPLNRQLNILEGAGLIRRVEPSRRSKNLRNEITQLGQRTLNTLRRI